MSGRGTLFYDRHSMAIFLIWLFENQKGKGGEMKRLEKIAFPITLIILFGAWELWARLGHIPVYRIPSPSAIFLQEGSEYLLLLEHLKVTAIEVLLGASIGISLAILMGILFYWIPFLKSAFYGVVRAINSIPIFAIAIILVIVFGVGILGKIVTACICIFFPVLSHTYNGLKSTDPVKMRFMRSINASRMQRLIYLEFPSALAEIFTSLETALTIAIVGVMFGEAIGGNAGLGFFILNRLYRMDNAAVLLATFIGAALGFLLVATVYLLKRKFLAWHPSMQKR